MSLILDALKKADDKRAKAPEQAPPTPETVELISVSNDAINAEALKTIAIKNWGMLCVCLFLCGLIVVLLYLLLNSKNEKNRQYSDAQAPTLQPIKRENTQAPNPATQQYINNNTPQSTKQNLDQNSKQNIEPGTEKNIDSLYAEAAPQTWVNTQNDTAAQKSYNSTQAIYDQANATYKNRSNIQPKNDDTPDQISNPNAVKDIKKMPKSFQESIPTIFYNQHNYPLVEGEPSIVLNKQILMEGDSLDNGIYIHAILENKVVLIKDNIYFSLRARNSWVNF